MTTHSTLPDPADADWRPTRQPLWDYLLLLYTLGSYGLGIGCVGSSSVVLNGIGLVILTHGLVLSAYVAHECMHGNSFSTPGWRVMVGNLMLWLNGSCYVPFQTLAKMHIDHHVNRIDYARCDIPGFLASTSPRLRSLILALEWCYIPALAILLRMALILSAFRYPQSHGDRPRVLVILALRSALFSALALWSPKAMGLYCLAYGITLHCLRLMDGFQHTYDALSPGSPIPDHHRCLSPRAAQAYEQSHTFSNLLSLRYPWLNGLLLNFGYHNAHHRMMTCPWYHLPALDRRLAAMGEYPDYHIPVLALLDNYHRFRVSRIFTGQGEIMDEQGNRHLEAFYGATEVSFLIVPVVL
jgi:fatty acid desaturase